MLRNANSYLMAKSPAFFTASPAPAEKPGSHLSAANMGASAATGCPSLSSSTLSVPACILLSLLVAVSVNQANVRPANNATDATMHTALAMSFLAFDFSIATFLPSFINTSVTIGNLLIRPPHPVFLHACREARARMPVHGVAWLCGMPPRGALLRAAPSRPLHVSLEAAPAPL